MNNLYQNSRYGNTRNRKQILILDIKDNASFTNLSDGTEFNIPLLEPLIIDSLSEIYLDNCITVNSNLASNEDNSAFVLRINEFNTDTSVASNNDSKNTIMRSMIIPNEHNNPSNNHHTVVQKGKKYNYMCDINPTKIFNLTGIITNLKRQPAFNGTVKKTPSAMNTYSIINIDETLSASYSNASYSNIFPLQLGDEISGLNASGQSISGSGTILAHARDNTEILHFSYPEIPSASFVNFNDNSSYSNPNIINFKIKRDIDDGGTGEEIIVNIPSSSTSNNNLGLVKSSPRFIAEFSIVSRE
jgi:hypothetical protein